LYKVGLGRLAIPKETVQDPYEFANDALLLMSHRWDPVTFWNAGTYGSHLTSSPKGGVLLQLVNYAAAAGASHVTVRVRGEYRQAVLLQPGHAPETLRIQTATHAAEVHLPEFPACAALQLS
jgi:hypothetical protein